MRLIRVFPRRTKATPDDALAYYDDPRHGRSALPGLFSEADEVHVDCTFTADKPKAERLANHWRHVAPVKVGGVAYGDRGLDFVPGRYIKHGYTFTSRGCPRRCWFCGVWKAWPKPEPILPLRDGWNVLDDNLLACERPHVEMVFRMLGRVGQQTGRRIEFTGGLEARALEDYQVGLLAGLRPLPSCFFAYDPGDPFETLESAARRMLAAGFSQASHRFRCYVLIGYPKDTFAAHGPRRLHANGDALAARDAERGEVAAGGGLAGVSAAMGSPRDYPRKGGNAMTLTDAQAAFLLDVLDVPVDGKYRGRFPGVMAARKAIWFRRKALVAQGVPPFEADVGAWVEWLRAYAAGLEAEAPRTAAG